MMRLKKPIKTFLRYGLPVAVVPKWSLDWWRNIPEFTFNARHYWAFCHPHNCGWPLAHDGAVDRTRAGR